MKQYQARLYLTIRKKIEVKAEKPKVALAALRSIAEHIAVHFGQFLLSKFGWTVEQAETEVSPLYAANKDWNAEAFKIFEEYGGLAMSYGSLFAKQFSQPGGFQSKAESDKMLCAGLEDLIDQVGVKRLVRALELVCIEKEDHLRSNWQDRKGGALWAKIAREFGRAHARISGLLS